MGAFNGCMEGKMSVWRVKWGYKGFNGWVDAEEGWMVE